MKVCVKAVPLQETAFAFVALPDASNIHSTDRYNTMDMGLHFAAYFNTFMSLKNINSMQSTIVNDKVKIIQGDDQIYHYIALAKSSIDIDTLQAMTEIGDTWNGTKLCANLVDLRDIFFIDSKTRAYAAEQYRAHVAGQAILIESKISSYFANLFLRFSKPKVPTKLFTVEQQAVDWLKEQMAKRSN